MKMKKNLCIVMLLLCLIMLSGCNLIKPASDSSGKPQTETGTDTPSVSTPDASGKDSGNSSGSDSQNQTGSNNSQYTIKDYYPFKQNTRYIYEGTGNEFAGYTKWVDYLKGDRIQERINNGGAELAKVIENKGGQLKLILSKESYYREDLTSKSGSSGEVLLKEPLVKGTSWSLSNGSKRYISDISADISTPSGKYKALEVTTEGKDSKDYDYYVLNVGLVKSVFKSGSDEVTSSLKEIQTNTSLTQNIRFYYPSPNDDKIYYLDQKLSFKTNDITKLTFEKQFKTAPKSDLMKLIGPNVKINTMYLNDDGMVYLDFSKELTSEMNLGASYEGMVLQSITNTVGGYYGVQKVYITIENQPYNSGHILKKKGEAFTVNTKGCVKHP